MDSGMGLFHTGIQDALFFSRWTPQSSVAYAFTFLFLIALGIASRGLLAYISVRERQVRVKNLAKADIIVHSYSDKDEKTRDADLTALVKSQARSITNESITSNQEGAGSSMRLINPWRMSVDVPRGLLQFVSSGIGYLLMLAVMTGNIGYFFAGLSGILIGEIAFGRFAFAPVVARAKSTND